MGTDGNATEIEDGLSRGSSSRSSSTSSNGLPATPDVLHLDGNVAPMNTPVQAAATVPIISSPSNNGFSDPGTIVPCQCPQLRTSDVVTAATSFHARSILNVSQIGVPCWPNASTNDSRSGSLPPSGFEWDLSRAQKAKSFATRWFVEWWLFEIISWVFSAVCMAIIFSVLLHYNNRPLPVWKLGLTLNSFISIFSGLSKASLLFPTAEALGQLKWNRFNENSRRMIDFEIIDSASRGPFGSMVLLAKTKGVYVTANIHINGVELIL
jgi:hypothetical protein